MLTSLHSPVTPLHFRPAQPLWHNTNTVHVQPIPCPENMVHVWGFDLDATPEALAYWYGLLSAEEQRRAERLIRAEHKRRWIAAHGLKREVLAAYVQVSPHKLNFIVQEGGKPALQEPGYQSWHFNLSHSQNRLLIAVTCCGAVGVDIEYVSTKRDFLALAQRFFHVEEVAFMRTQEERAARRQFYRTWAAKEALLKAQGTGLKGGLAQYLISGTGADKIELGSWAVHWLPLMQTGCCAALAVKGKNVWHWI